MNYDNVIRNVGSMLNGHMSESPEVLKLESAQIAAMSRWPAEKSPAGDWITHCNSGIQDILNCYGCRDFDGMMASQIVKHLMDVGVDGWTECSLAAGATHAQSGGLAFVGWINPVSGGHGHVATIAPRKMVLSPSWCVYVPILANVGKPPNDFKLASACFLKEQIPQLHCFKRTI